MPTLILNPSRELYDTLRQYAQDERIAVSELAMRFLQLAMGEGNAGDDAKPPPAPPTSDEKVKALGDFWEAYSSDEESRDDIKKVWLMAEFPRRNVVISGEELEEFINQKEVKHASASISDLVQKLEDDS